MKTERKTVEYFLELPYTVMLRRDEDGDWVARIHELEGCTAHGTTKPEALENLEDVQRAWIEDAIDAGTPVPEPTEEALPSGKWLQRVPRSLHRKLVQLAQEDRVSLNQLVTSMLSEAVGHRRLSRVSVQSRDWPSMPTLALLETYAYHPRARAGLGIAANVSANLEAYLREFADVELDWQINQPSPPMSLHLAENLVTTDPAASKKLEMTFAKVSERGKKEEQRHKEYAVGL